MERDVVQVPYAAYESVQTSSDRIIKRLIIALVISVILAFVSNAIWLYAWMQYDYESSETTTVFQQDGKGINNINEGDQGDVVNGAESNKDNQDKK